MQQPQQRRWVFRAGAICATIALQVQALRHYPDTGAWPVARQHVRHHI
jgi:hypothetical protein